MSLKAALLPSATCSVGSLVAVAHQLTTGLSRTAMKKPALSGLRSSERPKLRSTSPLLRSFSVLNPGRFECIGQRRSAWCRTAELREADSETQGAPPCNLCVTSDWMCTRARSATAGMIGEILDWRRAAKLCDYYMRKLAINTDSRAWENTTRSFRPNWF